MRLVSLLLAVAACGGSPSKSAVHNAPARAASRVAIAIVMQGNETWIGNDAEVPQVAADAPDRYFGALRTLRSELARLELTKQSDVNAALITYGDEIDVRLPIGPAAKLDAKAFGTQKDYYGTVRIDVVGGVRAGLAELSRADAPTKLLVVIGDGSDNHPDTAAPQLAELGQQAKAAGIAAHAILYRSRLSPESSVIGHLTASIHRVTTVANIAVAFESLVPEKASPDVPSTNGVAIAFLVQGWEAWIGNETEVPEITAASLDRFEGALVPLRTAIDAAQLASFPSQARGTIITYADKATVRMPMGPLRKVTGRAFGSQQDYYGTTGSELVSGVKAAVKELRRSNMSRQVLIILGDGTDTDMDAARSQLAQLKNDAERDHVEIHAVVHKSKLSSNATVVQHLTKSVITVAKRDDLPAALKPLFDGLRK